MSKGFIIKEGDESSYRRFYRRNLPHWQPPGADVFLTWRLKGSLSSGMKEKLKRWKERFRSNSKNSYQYSGQNFRRARRIFLVADRSLNRRKENPSYLQKDEIAQEVINALLFHHEEKYILKSFCVMPNHVHVLLEPLSQITGDRITPSSIRNQEDQPHSLTSINQSLKGYIAYRANKKLNREGSFWQNESFDHWIRSRPEFQRIMEYIESDPVRSGFVNQPSDWPHSSAHEAYKEKVAPKSWFDQF